MSLLSDAVRRATGRSIGQNIGGAIGGAVGGAGGAAIGSSIGGGITEAIDPTNRTNQSQGVAISQATQTNPQETMDSGSQTGFTLNQNIIPASFGGNIPQPPNMMTGVQQANLGGLILGGGALLSSGLAVIDLFFNDPITGETKRKKITRKFKAQVKQSVEIVGLEETARLLNTSQQVVVQILLKRFRNDGPFITKAAVRKTKATVRKMETVNMLSKQIAQLAGRTTRARATTKRASSSASRKTTVIQ
jgi:hypothetical protein